MEKAGGHGIRGFDGLRALALVPVFLQHYTRLGARYETGGYGVWLFFALSGFLIVGILHGERQRIEAGLRTRGEALGRFFWRRTLRIWPAYYLALGAFTVLAALRLVRDFPLQHALWHYAFLSNLYFGEVMGRWVGRFGHFWSLAVEQQFYLLAAPLLLLSPARWARRLCAALVLASVATNLSMRSGDASAMELYTNPLINFGALAFGGWMALGLPAKARPGQASWPVFACIAAIGGFIVGFQHVGAYPEAVAAVIAMAPFTFAMLASALLVAAVYLNQHSVAVRALEWAPVAYLGRVSYGFYLYHNLLPHWLVTKTVRSLGYDWRAPELLEATVAFGLGLGLATASWFLVEQPILKLKDTPWRRPAWLGGKPAGAAA